MNALQLLQQTSGANPDGDFGPQTFKMCSAYLGITDHAHAVHFWAQCAHESSSRKGVFTAFEENLNYSESALLRVFGKYFTAQQAKDYARKPEKIANRVYANRMGNGNEASGDGWRNRGRSVLQLTGKNNYKLFHAHMFKEWENVPLADSDEFLNAVANEWAFVAAKWFFDSNKLWDSCPDFSNQSIERLTRSINGGYNGLKHRKELTKKYANYEL